MSAEPTDLPVSDTMGVPDPRTSRQLYRTGVAALVVGIIALIRTSEVSDPGILAAGTAILVLGALPALNWARQAHAYFPVFEMFMLTSIPFYAVPLLIGHRQVLEFSDAATWQAALATVLFQLCAIATFSRTRRSVVRSSSLTVSLLPAIAYRYAQAGLWLNTLYLYLNSFTELIPPELSIVVRAVAFGVGTVSLFIEMRRWGAKQLMPWEKFIVALNLALQLIFLFRSLYLIVGISILLLAMIGYVSTSRRVPVVLMGLVFGVVAILHNGKSVMRDKYWIAGAPLPGLAGLPAFFDEWLNQGLLSHSAEAELGTSMLAERLFERASLFQMLCLVTQRTPVADPYLHGESYRHILAQLVPRAIWPDKPSSLESNTLLAVHYRLVAKDNPKSVSIAFGMIAESYANFGWLGCAALGCLLGFAYKRISLAALGQPQFSALGLLTILLTAWSFQVEQIFASWLVSLIQAAAVVIGGPMLFRVLFRQS
jgi:hypothetical protein